MSKKKTKKQNDESATAEESTAVVSRADMVDPFDRFGDWFDRWPTMFGRRFPDFHDLMPRLGEPFAGFESMRVEEFVDDDADEAVVRVEIPGVDPENDIDISLTGDRLTVSAEREERSTSGENGKRSEFRYGSFRRTMTVPPGVETDDVSASYVDGILEIRVPINGEEAAKTKVAVTRG